MTTEVIIEKTTTTDRDIKEPSKCKVLILNDDFTPAEFVVVMLMNVFKHDDKSAMDLTITVHNTGSAVAGVYPYEIAEQKMKDGVDMARENGFPLQLKIQEE